MIWVIINKLIIVDRNLKAKPQIILAFARLFAVFLFRKEEKQDLQCY